MTLAVRAARIPVNLTRGEYPNSAGRTTSLRLNAHSHESADGEATIAQKEPVGEAQRVGSAAARRRFSSVITTRRRSERATVEFFVARVPATCHPHARGGVLSGGIHSRVTTHDD